ncbi:hypothetical protein SAMN05444695_101396 [Rhodococcus triatomae]|uniref:Uncharacterized protein n=1 Tax=Rhodococcus triatomae TaxID=300028 RepID=A0A1G8ADV5_9NOCA|nr:hypothetical protein SAMN05444695_101396 [Rhodococcus triatomae]
MASLEKAAFAVTSVPAWRSRIADKHISPYGEPRER